MKALTLIELLVTITIIVLVTGISLAAYTTFSETKQAEIDARSLVSVMDKVRSKALFLEYPSDCTGLTGYTIVSLAGSSGELDSVRYYANCSEGQRGGETLRVLNDSVFTANFSINFLSATGSISTGADVTIRINPKNGNSPDKIVTISKTMSSSNQISDN